MAMCIRIEVAPEVAAQPELVKRLVEVCPVDIFAEGPDGSLYIVDGNLDECTLCDLCIGTGRPGSIRIVKLYEES